MKLNIDLPIGYHFSEAALEEDAKVITDLSDSLTKQSHQDFLHNREMLKRMPYSIIKHNNNLVAFELLDPAGGFRQQFVVPKHRGKGLGNAVERDLAQKCIK
uniref:Glucosamine-phosphate N-acetyltransferase n=1 Tax=Acrobeloides nanus TaxID=290746 RepID=A0A914DIB2_9BILA